MPAPGLLGASSSVIAHKLIRVCSCFLGNLGCSSSRVRTARWTSSREDQACNCTALHLHMHLCAPQSSVLQSIALRPDAGDGASNSPLSATWVV